MKSLISATAFVFMLAMNSSIKLATKDFKGDGLKIIVNTASFLILSGIFAWCCAALYAAWEERNK